MSARMAFSPLNTPNQTDIGEIIRIYTDDLLAQFNNTSQPVKTFPSNLDLSFGPRSGLYFMCGVTLKWIGEQFCL